MSRLNVSFSCSITNAGVLSSTGINGIGISSASGSAPTAMYRPNFTQAFQRTGPYPLFPGAAQFSSGGVVTNGKNCRSRSVIMIKITLESRQASLLVLLSYFQLEISYFSSQSNAEQFLDNLRLLFYRSCRSQHEAKTSHYPQTKPWRNQCSKTAHHRIPWIGSFSSSIRWRIGTTIDSTTTAVMRKQLSVMWYEKNKTRCSVISQGTEIWVRNIKKMRNSWTFETVFCQNTEHQVFQLTRGILILCLPQRIWTFHGKYKINY